MKNFRDYLNEAKESLDESENPHVSKQWPGKLHRKIDVLHKGKYQHSSNAYENLKAAKAGHLHSNPDHKPEDVKAVYSESVEDNIRSGKAAQDHAKAKKSFLEPGADKDSWAKGVNKTRTPLNNPKKSVDESLLLEYPRATHAKSHPHGMRHSVFDKEGRPKTVETWHKTPEARDTFARKVAKDDNFHEIISSHSPNVNEAMIVGDAKHNHEKLHHETGRMLDKIVAHHKANKPSKGSNWGHVGDAGRLHDQVKEIHDQLYHKGEYAKDAK